VVSIREYHSAAGQAVLAAVPRQPRAVRNQQTTGIAEAFTFIDRGPVRPGDYLSKLSGADDLWLGCWGLIRAHQRPAAIADRDLIALQPDPQIPAPAARRSPSYVGSLRRMVSRRSPD
jgi:hypothetical protein